MCAMSPRLLRPRASGGFNPKSISGLILWLDASDISTVSTDTGVSEWRDKSGLEQKMLQGSGGNQPAYLTNENGIGGKRALGFTASSSHFMRGTFSHSLTGITVLIAQTLESTAGANGRSFSLTVSGQSTDFQGTGHLAPSLRSGSLEQVGCQHDGGLRVARNITYASPFIQCVRNDGTTLSNQINNGTAATYTPASAWNPTMANMMLSTFNSSGAASGFWSGRIAEIIVYSRQITAAEQLAAQRYLAEKYGITLE
jgi:hypothetical protein